jgi:hypothetical protein
MGIRRTCNADLEKWQCRRAALLLLALAGALAPAMVGAQGIAPASDLNTGGVIAYAVDPRDDTAYVGSGLSFDPPGLRTRFATRIFRLSPERIATHVAGEAQPSIPSDRTTWNDGRPALEARFTAALAMAFDNAGNLYVLDADNHVIRRILRRFDGSFGTVETYAGSGAQSPAGTQFAAGTELNALETTFSFSPPDRNAAVTLLRFGGLAYDDTRNRLWVADTFNGVVRGILLSEAAGSRAVLSIGNIPANNPRPSAPTFIALGRDSATGRVRWMYVANTDCSIWRRDLDLGTDARIGGDGGGCFNTDGTVRFDMTRYDGRQATSVALWRASGLASSRNFLYSGQFTVMTRINVIDGSIDRIVGDAGFGILDINFDRPALEARIATELSGPLATTARGDVLFSTGVELPSGLRWNNGSTTQVTVSPTNSVPGDSVTLTARINGDAPTGTVSFRSQTGTSTFSNLCLNVPVTRAPGSDDGTATCSTTMLPAGSGNVVADYAGDLNNLGSNAVAPFARSFAAATLTLASVSPGTVAPGVNVTATVSIALRGNPISPEGAVTVEYLDRNNVMPLCSFNYPAANGTASASGSCSGSFPTPGPRMVRARWQSLTGIDPAESNQLAVSVTGFPSTTTTLSTTNPAVFGQALGLTATIEETSSFTPTGSVDFVDVRPSGDVVLCAAVALASTVATCNVAAGTLPAGERELQARYGGDVRFEPSTGSLTQTVRKAGTTLSVLGTVPSAAFGGTPIPVVVGLVVNAPGAGQPSGRVIVAATGTTPGTTPFLSCEIDLPSTPQALSCPLPFSATGRYRVGASYVGDTNFDGSSASATVEHVVEPLFRDEFE